MAKKNKHRIQMPALSPADKAIYYCLIVCSAVASIFLYPAIIGSYRSSVFRNAHILAHSNLGGAILMFCGFFLGFGLVLIFDWLRRKKQPIFGNSKVIYGLPQGKSIYPLFSKQFWNNLQSNRKHKIRIALCILALLLVISATSIALPPRHCLYDDGSIVVYNCFNTKTTEYNYQDIGKIRIFVREYHNRRGPDDWGIAIELILKDGNAFIFNYNDFRSVIENTNGSIAGMRQIKQLFDSNVIIEGKEHLPKVIQDMALNQEETDLLYLLFDSN